MTVRQSLLAILSIGPCYGYQLRAEFDRRTGSTWPLNVGQTYTTLERLERDGLVRRGGADDDGHLLWEITPAGRRSAGQWLETPVSPSGGTRDELAIKVAIASTLPGADIASVLRAQRDATAARLEVLRGEQQAELDAADAGTADTGAEALARRLVHDGVVFDTEAELAWLEHAARVIDRSTTAALPLSTDKPRRGRPARVVAD